MRISVSLFWISLLISTCLFSTVANAQDGHWEHKMTDADRGVFVYAHPGEMLKFTYYSEAADENVVQIYRHKDGALLKYFHNKEIEQGRYSNQWQTPKNESDETIVYFVVGRTLGGRAIRIFGRRWGVCPFRESSKSNRTQSIGWEDAFDNDYNDSQIYINVIVPTKDK